MGYEEVLEFWFDDDIRKKWFIKSNTFDQEIHDQFFSVYQLAISGKLSDWLHHIRGYLAMILLLDQFPRNMFRNTGQAFLSDALALYYARQALLKFNLEELSQIEQVFLCMPFMHAESLEVQAESVELFKRIGRERNIHYALEHYKIIEQFGRFPFRNEALNRQSTELEINYLLNHENF